MEGVLQRTDVVGQLQQKVQSQEEQIKKLKGDMQTREREVYHAKQRAEIEKFKSELDKTQTQSKASAKMFEKRLDDALGQAKGEVRRTIAESRKGSTSES